MDELERQARSLVAGLAGCAGVVLELGDRKGMEQLIITALRATHAAGRAEGLEAGAGVADARATKWSSAHQQIIEELNDRAGARMVGAYYAEAAEIAAAIRALK